MPIVLLAVGCEIINPEEDTPTYVKIDGFDVQINDPQKEGSASSDISSVWVYYNNNPVGVFDLPCNVPVITEGDAGIISIAPGITLNGFQDLQPIYSFYTYDSFTLKTAPGQTVNFDATTSYYSATKFLYMEDFEVGNSFDEFVVDATDYAKMKRSDAPADVFEGGGSGLVYMDADHPVSESITNKGFDIAPGEVFLEVDYKSTASFQIGMYNTLTTGVDVYEYFAGVKPSNGEWKKIYIELGSYTTDYPGVDYKLMIRTSLEGLSEGYVLFDNIKVVSF